jgi:hypothetical protein
LEGLSSVNTRLQKRLDYPQAFLCVKYFAIPSVVEVNLLAGHEIGYT